MAAVAPQSETDQPLPQPKPSWDHHKTKHFRRKGAPPQPPTNPGSEQEKGHARGPSNGEAMYNQDGHRVNHNGHKVTPGIAPDGESGRKWFNPWHFLRICWSSSCTASKITNVLWPFTIAAMVLHYSTDNNLWIFICAYVGMVPAANLVGFAGQELARKLPKVAGVILETTFGSIVEIILFAVLIRRGEEQFPGMSSAQAI